MRWPQCPRSGFGLQEEGRKRDGTGGWPMEGAGTHYTHARRIRSHMGERVRRKLDAQTPKIRSLEKDNSTKEVTACLGHCASVTTQRKHNVFCQRETESQCLAVGASYTLHPHKQVISGLEHERSRHREREGRAKASSAASRS